MKKNKEYEKLLKLPKSEKTQIVDLMSASQRHALLIYLDLRVRRADRIIRTILIAGLILTAAATIYVATLINW